MINMCPHITKKIIPFIICFIFLSTTISTRFFYFFEVPFQPFYEINTKNNHYVEIHLETVLKMRVYR